MIRPLSLAHWVIDVTMFFTMPERRWARRTLRKMDERKRERNAYYERAGLRYRR